MEAARAAPVAAVGSPGVGALPSRLWGRWVLL